MNRTTLGRRISAAVTAPIKKKAVILVKRKPLESKYSINTIDIQGPDFEVEIDCDGERAFSFTFESTGAPFCCGIVEWGSFNSNTWLTKCPRELKLQAINKLMEQVYEFNLCKGKNGVKTAFFTLISDTTCNLVKDALEISDLFTLVKSFKNYNSGRTNDMYVSNN